MSGMYRKIPVVVEAELKGEFYPCDAAVFDATYEPA